MVQLLCQCTCPTQFPMVRVGDNGKYKVGDKLIIFVRILRRHIMVRVGGGWQELSEFLRVKDPCRARHTNHQLQLGSQSSSKSNSPNSMILRSRLIESNQHLSIANHGHQGSLSQQNHHHLSYNHRSTGSQRLISGSASMSWLSHNT